MPTHRDSTATPSPEAIEEILEFTRKLATLFDPEPMLADIVAVAKRVLRAERGSVLLYDRGSDELVFKLSADVPAVRTRPHAVVGFEDLGHGVSGPGALDVELAELR